MGTNQNENETDQELDKRLKCACGWDEEQLLKELEDAEKEISEEDLPLSGKYSFERLLKDIEERKIEPERGDREEAESGQNLETFTSAARYPDKGICGSRYSSVCYAFPMYVLN